MRALVADFTNLSQARASRLALYPRYAHAVVHEGGLHMVPMAQTLQLAICSSLSSAQFWFGG
jgi:hypothetical protein